MQKLELGNEWTELLECFLRFELRDSRCEGTLGSAGRPEQVKWWQKRARKVDPPVKPEEVSEIDKKWWGWWKSLQPNWRETMTIAGPLNVTHQAITDDGDWMVLEKSGINGMFSVVACLSWWGKAVARDDASFLAAIADVRWVIEQILVSSVQLKRVRNENGEEGHAAKRTRC